MKISKFPFLLLAFVMAIASGFAFNTGEPKTGKFSTLYWYIGSNSNSEVSKPENWTTVGEVCNIGTTVPCFKRFTSAIRADFDAHIAGYTSVAIANADATLKRQ